MRQGQLGDYEARSGKPFAHEAFVRELAELRDQLKVGLSEHPPEGLPPVAERPEKIKALREANTVEVAPVRTGTRKTKRAETLVTARIRERRAEEPVDGFPEPAAVEVKPEPDQKPEEPPATLPAAVISMPEPVKPDYRQSATLRRQGNEAQLRLF